MGYYDQSPSRGDYDVGRLGLSCKVIDSDPYYAAVVYQYGKPIAIIDCLSGKTGIVRGLAEDDVETLRDVFHIRVTPHERLGSRRGHFRPRLEIVRVRHAPYGAFSCVNAPTRKTR